MSVSKAVPGLMRAASPHCGTTAAHFEFDAWGNLLASSSDGVPGGFYYRFIGGLGVRYDTLAELHYMRLRWYESGQGTFLSPDPAGGSSSHTRYAYANESPTVNVDPSGAFLGSPPPPPTQPPPQSPPYPPTPSPQLPPQTAPPAQYTPANQPVPTGDQIFVREDCTLAGPPEGNTARMGQVQCFVVICPYDCTLTIATRTNLSVIQYRKYFPCPNVA